MHPILADRRHVLLSGLAWLLVGALLAVLVRALTSVGWAGAIAFALPLALGAAPVSLSVWYLCRALPIGRAGTVRIGGTVLAAALVTALLWAAVGRAWWALLATNGAGLSRPVPPVLAPLLVEFGTLAYLLTVAVQYLLQAMDESAQAAQRALEAQVAHRDAELRALRAQVDPHFLFNSLNSIAGLVAVDPARARLMCQLLGDFLRDSLALGAADRIPLGREVALAEQYLRIEQVRFGARLTVETSIDPASAAVPVPPLILQPLVENAVRHGIATLLDGGDIRIAASRDGRSRHRRGDQSARRRRAADRHGTGPGARAAPVDRRVRRDRAHHGGSGRRPLPGLALAALRPGGRRMSPPRQRLRIVVVDDEEPARLALRRDLETLDDVAIVAECANGFEAVSAVADEKPDVLLLDVQMPKLDGFDVLELVGRDVPVIFVTAYDEFALRAFEVHAVDYLLKPFTRERLVAALDRARARRPPAAAPAALRAAARPAAGPLERVVIRDGAQVHVVPVDRIDYVEAQDDYVAFRTGGRMLLKEQTLGALEGQLDRRRFVRIHRSYLLNVERLARVELYAKDSRVAVLADGTKLPVSRAGYQRLQELL